MKSKPSNAVEAMSFGMARLAYGKGGKKDGAVEKMSIGAAKMMSRTTSRYLAAQMPAPLHNPLVEK